MDYFDANLIVSPVSSGHLGLLLGLYSEISEPAGERGYLHHHCDMRSGHCTHHIGPSSCWYLPSVLHEVPQWHLQGNHIPVQKGCSLFELRSVLDSTLKLHYPCSILHKQSNHKRLRALHNKLFGCLAWMLLLLVYSHHLWKQWHFIPKTSHYSMKCNMTRGQYFRFEFTDSIEYICLLLWDSNGLMRQWLLWQLNGIINETTGPPFFPTDNE